MKINYILSLCIIGLLVTTLYSQADVRIQFYHKFGSESLERGVSYLTESGNLIEIDWYGWYGTFPALVMKDGSTRPCDQDVFLVWSHDSKYSLSMSNVDIEQVDAFRFYIGVDFARNHLDPATYPSWHPLAFQFPNMHWGWIAGYIFQLLEGKSSRDPGQTKQPFFIHSIGNELYTLVEIPVRPVIQEDGMALIDIYVDLKKMIDTLDVNEVVAMGAFDENKYLIRRKAKEGVFYDPNVHTTSLNELLGDFNISLFPNPIKGGQILNISVGDIKGILELGLIDHKGKIVNFGRMEEASGGQLRIPSDLPIGNYWIWFLDSTGKMSVKALQIY